MPITIPSHRNTRQPEYSAHASRGLRRVLLALAIGGTIAGGAVLARVPASAEHAAATASAARSTLARVQYGYCPSTTLPCP